MEDAIRKARTLIDALEWIREFRDKITVIKLGGSVMESAAALRSILLDVVFMATVGMRPVLVHGGGARISRAMAEQQISPRFIQGRRYTDAATLAIVEQVLVGQVNQEIAGTIEELGGRAMTLSFLGTNVLSGERMQLTDPQGNQHDLGFVGRVTKVDRGVIENLCYAGQVPVIPSMCVELDDAGEPTAQKLNVNADTAATAVAQALRAEKLVFLSDVNGVRRDKDDPASLIDSLTESEARELIAEGVIEAGMIPKVEACLETLARGVSKVHIVDGGLPHSLLLEVYTSRGVGTQIVHQR